MGTTDYVTRVTAAFKSCYDKVVSIACMDHYWIEERLSVYLRGLQARIDTTSNILYCLIL